MALPKIVHPTTDVTVPSTKKKIKIRTMTVKEEKILLIAKESGESGDIIGAVKQIVSNCIVTPNFDINTLAIFDLDYLFIKIRGFSVSNIIKQAYNDNEDDKVYQVEINIDNLEVVFPETVNDKIAITGDMILQLSYPSVKFYDNKTMLNSTDTALYFLELFKASNPVIHSGGNVVNIKSSTDQEVEEFLDSLPSKAYNEINDFFDNLPGMKYEVKYTNSKGTERTIPLSKLNDFFSLA